MDDGLNTSIKEREATNKRLTKRLMDALERAGTRQQIDDMSMLLVGLELVKEKYIDGKEDASD